MDPVTPTSIEIVNQAMVAAGQEATVDYRLKALYIVLVEGGLRAGYVRGSNDATAGKPAAATKESFEKFCEVFKQ